MRRFHFVLSALILAVLGCSDGKKAKPEIEEPEEEPLPERYVNDELPMAADELFDDFIYYFSTNEQLQRRRIDFPVTVKNGKQETQLEEANWQMDPLYISDGVYTLIFDSAKQREQSDTTINKAVVERILLSTDSMRQYQFMRNDEGRWRMTGITMLPLNENPDAAFLRFYQQFATDSLFCQRSLSDMIAFSGPDPDDDFNQMEGFITPDSWEAFAPELPCDSIFNIVYGKSVRQGAKSKEKVFVVCGIANGQEIELTFRQKKGRWKLTKLSE